MDFDFLYRTYLQRMYSIFDLQTAITQELFNEYMHSVKSVQKLLIPS